MAVTYQQDTIFLIDTQLTSVGTGTSLAVTQNNFFATKSYTLIAVVASIGTNVVVRLEGSIDGTNYAPIIADKTITSNGSHAYNVNGMPVKFIRANFVSKNGGSPTVDFHLAAL